MARPTSISRRPASPRLSTDGQLRVRSSGTHSLRSRLQSYCPRHAHRLLFPVQAGAALESHVSAHSRFTHGQSEARSRPWRLQHCAELAELTQSLDTAAAQWLDSPPSCLGACLSLSASLCLSRASRRPASLPCEVRLHGVGISFSPEIDGLEIALFFFGARLLYK